MSSVQKATTIQPVAPENKQVIHDTENKVFWLKHGEQKEIEFVNTLSRVFGYNAVINPEKERDPTKPDIIVNGALSDLKTQNTPFFKASSYGIPSRWAVTFNHKDWVRYKELYPDIVIYFWIDWNQKELKLKRNYTTEYLYAIYAIPFSEIDKLITNNIAPKHEYKRRKASTKQHHPLKGIIDNGGNSKFSYVIDLRRFKPMIILNSEDKARHMLWSKK